MTIGKYGTRAGGAVTRNSKRAERVTIAQTGSFMRERILDEYNAQVVVAALRHPAGRGSVGG